VFFPNETRSLRKKVVNLQHFFFFFVGGGGGGGGGRDVCEDL
jgi:hypothetical protein